MMHLWRNVSACQHSGPLLALCDQLPTFRDRITYSAGTHNADQRGSLCQNLGLAVSLTAVRIQ